MLAGGAMMLAETYLNSVDDVVAVLLRDLVTNGHHQTLIPVVH